jgi:hypothetical protein
LRPLFDQKQSSGSQVILLRFAQTLVPSRELVGVLDVPCHQKQYIPLMEYIQEADLYLDIALMS